MAAAIFPVAAVVSTAVGGLMQVGGYSQAADASRVAGRRQNVASQFEAEQLEQQAGQSVAAAQRDAKEEKRRADLAASRAIALAAASGGGASDATVVKIIADLKGEGAYRSAVALYRGEENARRLRMAAKGKRYEGAVAEEGGQLKGSSYDTMAAASLFNTGATLFGRYGGKPPSGGGRSSGILDAGSGPVSDSYA